MYVDIQYTGETLCKVKLSTGEVTDVICDVRISGTADLQWYYDEFGGYEEFSNIFENDPEAVHPDEYIEVKPDGSKEEGTDEIVEILEVYDYGDLVIESLGRAE